MATYMKATQAERLKSGNGSIESLKASCDRLSKKQEDQGDCIRYQFADRSWIDIGKDVEALKVKPFDAKAFMSKQKKTI